MNDAPLVSFIIPVYNTEKYLAECLDSVCNQTVREIEIICVNDGSRDSSLEILQAYAQKDERFRVFDQPNSGVSVARNRGIDEAKGKYICFVDADDKVDLDMCEQTLAVAEKTGVDLVFHLCNSLESPKYQCLKTLKNYEFINPSLEERALGLSCMEGGPWEYLIKRSFLLAEGLHFPLDIRVGEDICWVYQMWMLVRSFAIVPKQFYWYRNNVTSALGSLTSNSDKIFDIFKGYNIAKPYYQADDLEKLRSIFVRRSLNFFYFGYCKLKKEERRKWKKEMDVVCDDYILRFIRDENDLRPKIKSFYRRMYGTRRQQCGSYFLGIWLNIIDWKTSTRRLLFKYSWARKLYRKFRPSPVWRKR